ncbi:MAG: deoxyuridine 5'-triphosphate nucleotidohydrolase [Thermofilaceae archaeon]|nr:deoxyuridine 5'-triphosphate nucleotidohydrolase [Thermofilaceae archaeon]MCX8181180.1 deoxyuridine 5'-triphosphate nucleotidohydrolase [Thermofilaceae archaeon]MDW8004803.1 deoxyuridine 5'-triphosphate nucleotidohydrolase [Thermofilaceae archaeon]
MILGREEILKLIKGNPPLITGWINLDAQLQPSGFDLSLMKISKFIDSGFIDFSNRKRKIPNTIEVFFDPEGKVNLEKGCYLLTFNEYLNLPLDVAAIAKPRSSLIRSGATVETALWDPGYRGRSKALLVVFNEYGLTLEQNARVVQLIFMRVSNVDKGYCGLYQGET